MAQLTNAEEGPPSLDVTEWHLDIVRAYLLVRLLLVVLLFLEHLLVHWALRQVINRGDADLKLVLSSRIGDDLPVMDSLCETNTSKEITENVLVLLDINGPSVVTDLYALFHFTILRDLSLNWLRVPTELRYNDSDNISLVAHLWCLGGILVSTAATLTLFLLAILGDRSSDCLPHSYLMLLGLFQGLSFYFIVFMILVCQVLLDE